jgi:hypothetical protein
MKKFVLVAGFLAFAFSSALVAGDCGGCEGKKKDESKKDASTASFECSGCKKNKKKDDSKSDEEKKSS